MKFLTQFLVVLVVFFAIDIFWLGVVARNLYAKYLGFIMSPNVNWAAALLFYVIFIIGVMVFVLQPALEKQSLMHAFIMGAFFGFVTYATYDLTNLATLKDWPITITIIDLIWGTVLSSSVSVISYLIISRFFL
ncbi:MAG TPA: DUF2177 domain-containing protein [Erysipelotrichaceae bacterium]|nr:DUF2177 domain-containing protein [Erysipelotrichaceae bacterium]